MKTLLSSCCKTLFHVSLHITLSSQKKKRERAERAERAERERVEKRREKRGAHATQCNVAHLHFHAPSHCSTSQFPLSLVRVFFTFCRVGTAFGLHAENSLSCCRELTKKQKQRSPRVLPRWFRHGIEELAREPGDEAKLQEQLPQERREAGGQRAEFARRGLDDVVRRDKSARRRHAATKQKARQSSNEQGRRILRGTGVACPQALPEAQNWKATAKRGRRQKTSDSGVSEVTDLLTTLSGTPTADPQVVGCAHVRQSQSSNSVKPCARMEASVGWTGTGNQGHRHPSQKRCWLIWSTGVLRGSRWFGFHTENQQVSMVR